MRRSVIRTLLFPVRAVFGSVALLLLGNGLINTLLTLRGTSEGFSAAVMGFIMSAYFVGFVGGTWVSGRLIRRMGHIRAFAFCASLCATGALLHVVLVDPWFWFVLRFIYGLSFVTLMTVIESWLNSKVAHHERGRVFSMYMVVNLGAIAFAQQILQLASPDDYLLFTVTAILICWALLPLTMTRRNQPTVPDKPPKSTIKRVLGFAPIAVIAAAMSGLAMGAFWTMTPIYLSALGFDIGQISLVMSFTILGGALLQVPIGRFSDRHDRQQVLIWVCLLAAIVALLMPWAGSNYQLMGLFFIWGGFAFTIYPLSVAYLVDLLHPDELVSGSTDMLVLHGAGSAVAPLLVGGIMSLFGAQALPLYIAGVLAILAACALYRRRKFRLLPGDHGHFEPLYQTSTEALDMLFDDRQPDLFDDLSFYDDRERDRLLQVAATKQH